MNILVTGGAGFIGRWVVKKLVYDGHTVTVFDNLSNGRIDNIQEFAEVKFVKGNINNKEDLDGLFKEKYDIIYHLAASINVQDSIDNPEKTFLNDTVGTFNILERAKKQMFGKKGRMNGASWILGSDEETCPCKVVFMSTCMVYDICDDAGISEIHPVKPISPYGGSKIAAENMVLSYYNTYKLPTVVIRPFNTYGPFQKTGGEGGVIAIFIKNSILGEPINIYGTGEQTRDFLYVEDCADFVVQAGYNSDVNGEIINAGTGRDISINELSKLVSKNKVPINHIKHIHPQSEILKLKCDCSKAKRIMGWKPKYSLESGLIRTEKWIKNLEYELV
ncbi:dTDP-glucose 4,6-dehydratase [Clostridium neuense]|uniref:dTDP-glucose 4,6-dehydratase n=1 Tax=Clostridium neuense TaxID=1728934 RepID=A0ABW8TL34_9CLOT